MKKIFGLYGDIHHDDEVVKTCLRNVFGDQIILISNPDDLPWNDLEAQVALYVSMKETNTTPKPDGTINNWITPEREQALYDYVSNGGAALFVHNGLVGFGTDSVYHQLTGGVFIQHPPLMPVTYVPIKKEHPIVQGVNAFSGEDEKYFCHIDVAQVDDIFLAGDDPKFPGSISGWCKTIGKGRTAAVTPGHTLEVVNQPSMTQLVKNAAAWVLKEK